MKRIRVYISGRVQGVFFRAETQRAANGFRLTGWIRNISDGRVEALFEGKIKTLIRCWSGAVSARRLHALKTC